MNEDDNQQQAAAHQDDLNRQEEILRCMRVCELALQAWWQTEDYKQQHGHIAH